jgi:hypothetical protein
MRQGELALEEAWVTQNCWFRLYTTLIGIEVTDIHLAVRHAATPESVYKTLSIKKFADILSYDLIFNSATPRETRSGESEGSRREREEVAAACTKDHSSGLMKMEMMKNIALKGPSKGQQVSYQRQMTCALLECRGSHKTQWKCVDCWAEGKEVPLCFFKDKTKRNCLIIHQGKMLSKERKAPVSVMGGGAGGSSSSSS